MKEGRSRGENQDHLILTRKFHRQPNVNSAFFGEIIGHRRRNVACNENSRRTGEI